MHINLCTQLFFFVAYVSILFFSSFFFLGKFHITAHNNWEKTTTLLPFPARLQHSKTAKVLSMCQLTTELSCYVIFQVGCLLNHCTAASVNIVLPLTVVVFVCFCCCCCCCSLIYVLPQHWHELSWKWVTTCTSRTSRRILRIFFYSTGERTDPKRHPLLVKQIWFPV